MVIANSKESPRTASAGRSLVNDLMRVYVAIIIGLPAGFAVDLGLQRLGVLYNEGWPPFALFALAVGPLVLLYVLLAPGTRSKGLFVARWFGAYLGWLAFLSLFFGLYLWQPIFALRLFVLSLVLSSLLAGAVIAAAFCAGSFAWTLAIRRLAE